jgi:hypothetical protein
MRRPIGFTLIAAFALLQFVAACAKSDAPPASGAKPPADSPTARVASCPATGQWAECSIMYRLERSGLVPEIDSDAKPTEKELVGKPLMLKIGRMATLELYLYPDSVARVADGKKLDRTHLVDGTAPQTMEHERTLIESANVIGLLTSLNSHQRERVSDAITAGPPQPAKP